MTRLFQLIEPFFVRVIPLGQLAFIQVIGRIAVGYSTMPIDADVAYCKAVNDWTAEHWGPYMDRVAPGIVLPLRDVTASVKELERCVAAGMRPALLPDGMSDPAYYSPAWEPMWEALSALKIPATMHVGTRQSAPGSSAEVMKTAPYKGLPMVGW